MATARSAPSFLAPLRQAVAAPKASTSAEVVAGKRWASYKPVSASPKPYPFAPTALIPDVPASAIPPASAPLNLLGRINHTLLHGNASSQFLPLFARRSRTRVPASSVLAVTYYPVTGAGGARGPNTSTFSGVLIGVRRRGADVSFTLRNVLMKTGIEQTFSLGSGAIKEIKVLKRGEVKRAKLFWVRDDPKALQKMASGIAKGQR